MIHRCHTPGCPCIWTGPASIKRTHCAACVQRARLDTLSAHNERSIQKRRLADWIDARGIYFVIAALRDRGENDLAEWLAQDVHRVGG